ETERTRQRSRGRIADGARHGPSPAGGSAGTTHDRAAGEQHSGRLGISARKGWSGTRQGAAGQSRTRQPFRLGLDRNRRARRPVRDPAEVAGENAVAPVDCARLRRYGRRGGHRRGARGGQEGPGAVTLYFLLLGKSSSRTAVGALPFGG